ncbi:MAG: hypothetical protein L0287_10950 [Anaerolineae bacterium]|nr:hypothetical protein [Anaerolineae bacterium]MCI0611135.1 hypothetical protein [Anaerolineae bacterium]
MLLKQEDEGTYRPNLLELVSKIPTLPVIASRFAAKQSSENQALLTVLGIAHLHCTERTICPFGTNRVQVSSSYALLATLAPGVICLANHADVTGNYF